VIPVCSYLQVRPYQPPQASTSSPPDIGIPGLILQPHFVTEDEEAALLQEVYQRPWEGLSKRRVQHYGYAFVYTLFKVGSQIIISDYYKLLLFGWVAIDGCIGMLGILSASKGSEVVVCFNMVDGQCSGRLCARVGL
jgi:hypothetical protein